ncbi:MAG TPA: cytochrome P460 family protein [Chthoniobacteraceae bacterium]
MNLWITTGALLTLGALISVLGSESDVITKETAFTFYKPFERLTKQPYLVDTLTIEMCATVRPAGAPRKMTAGLHERHALHIYADPLAADAIARHLMAYPTGATIVKEKLAPDGATNAVAGMIKRAPGHDEENGNWEYFYAKKSGEFTMGRLANCVDCHAKAKLRSPVSRLRLHMHNLLSLHS